MYDMDQRDPWDWTDYVRVGIGVVIVIGILYFVIANMPEPDFPTLCCQCCCP